MTENVTNMLLAQLLLARDPPPQRTEQPLNFDNRWWPDAFESQLPYWLGLTRTQPPPPPLWLDRRNIDRPFRRGFEEFDAEYPGRPLRRP